MVRKTILIFLVFGLGLGLAVGQPVAGGSSSDDSGVMPAPSAALAVAWPDNNGRPSLDTHPDRPLPERAERGVQIRLQQAVFDPLREQPGLSRALTVAEDDPDAGDYHIVQFKGPILADWRAQLEGHGARIMDYVPDFAYIIKADAAMLRQVRGMDAVRWTGLLQPAFRVSNNLLRHIDSGRSDVLVELVVRGFVGEPASLIANELAGRSVAVTDQYEDQGGGAIFHALMAEGMIEDLAHVPEIAWIEPDYEPALANSVARSGTIMNQDLVDSQLGLYGQGQIVAVGDTGLSTGNPATVHLDFAGRVIGGTFGGGSCGTWADQDSHGTHVAGSVLGSGARSGADIPNQNYAGSHAGIAPEASLYVWSFCNNFSGLPAAPYANYYGAKYGIDANLRISTNSWGYTSGQGQYNTFTRETDRFVWDFPDMVISYAAGNEGVDSNANGVVNLGSMNMPATGKNVITVGASENLRMSGGLNPGGPCSTWGSCFSGFPANPINSDRISDNIDGMAAFSSRGPTQSGRLKPDVVAPGSNIVSARNESTGTGWGVYDTYYLYMGGTSMATPLVAGAAAVIREYFDVEHGLNPSSALVKAMLINGAVDMTPGQYGTGSTQEIIRRPDNSQGWGRVSMSNTLLFDGPRTLLFEEHAGLNTGQTHEVQFQVVDASVPLRVSLVWADAPGTEASHGALVNDLDLEVAAPGGVVHIGNGIITGGSPDRNNNVEGVDLSPTIGNYTVTVRGFNVPDGPQPFALVITGAIIEGDNPIPTLTAIDPTSALAGSPDTTLTATGSGFAANSVVRFGTEDLATTYVNDSELTALVPASELTTVGSVDVTVFNPAPGGGTSGAQMFEITGAPVAEVIPASLSSTLAPDTTNNVLLTISNLAGAGELIWTIDQAYLAVADRVVTDFFAPVGGSRDGVDLSSGEIADQRIEPQPQSGHLTGDWSEGFEDILTLPGAGWALINRSDPLGTSNWFQGNDATFPAQAGPANSYIGANFNNTAGGTGIISNWLITPELSLHNGTELRFWTRVPTGSGWPDRLEVRMSTAGASTDVGGTANSVGDFDELLLSVNAGLTVGGYPEVWTEYVVTVSGLPSSTSGRLAFRYFVTDAGPSGVNSNYIGIDSVSVTQPPAVGCDAPENVPWLSVVPDAGNTAAGDSDDVTVGFDATGLGEGIYDALLCVTSNDPVNPLIEVPVEMEVTSTGPTPSETTITSILPSGNQTVGESYTVTVSVTGDSPTGTVNVSDGTGGSCTITLPDPSCAMTSTTVGLKTISADYSGDGANDPSSDTIGYEITQAASTTTIMSITPADEQVVNVAYTVEVSVSGYNPIGSVSVSDGTGGSCMITLPDTSCAMTSTTVGTKTISADYSGDASNAPSSDTTSYEITQASSTTTITGFDPAGGQEVNEPYTVFVTVSGDSPGGTVAVSDGTGGNCTITLPDGSCVMTSTTIGEKTITADYSGDATHSASGDTASYTISGTPVAEVIPASLSRTLAADTTDNALLTISNLAGTSELLWTIDQAYPAVADRVVTDFIAAVGGSRGEPEGFDSVMADAEVQPQPQSGHLTGDWSEGFEDILTLPGVGWALINRSDPPGTTSWLQGNDSPFPAQSGPVTSYIGANFNNTAGATGIISNWLITPEISLHNGTELRFWTRVPTGSSWPDRLEVRMSTAGASTDVGGTANSVGDFDELLLSVNAGLTVGGYPEVWTEYVVTVSGLPSSTSGRLAFRYFVTDAGPSGVNSNYIGIDSVSVTQPAGLGCTAPENVPWLSVAPDAGNTAAGDSDDVTVGFDATGLGEGIYDALLCVASNDPVNPLIEVPVEMEVTSTGPTPSETTITSILPSGSQTVGQSYTVTVSVTGDSPTGTVAVSDGTGGSCQITLPDPSCAMTSTTVGLKTISADYSGDGANDPSSDTTTYEITQAASTTTIMSITPADEQVVNVAYTVEVSVSGYNPTGSVSVSDGTGGSCTITLPDASCAMTSTTVGGKTITASYGGDANNTGSMDNTAYQIVAASSTTTITDIDPVGSQTVGESYTVTVSVTGDSPTGTVNVSDGTGGSCQITLPDPSCAMTSTTVGIKTISADYSGDGANDPSSDTTTYEITQAASTTTITMIDPTDAQLLHRVYTVTVNVNGSDPTGTVTVDDGHGVTCLIELPETSCELVSIVMGERTITASYAGDASHQASSDNQGYEILAGALAELVFEVQPQQVGAGETMADVVVRLHDVDGNLVEWDNHTQVFLSLEDNPSGATLSGSLSQVVVNGEAVFTDLSLDQIGEGYTLRAGTWPYEPLFIDDFALDGGETYQEMHFVERASSSRIVGLAFGGEVSGIGAGSTWASDLRMDVGGPSGSTFAVGGFDDPAPVAWDFDGASDDGEYFSLHMNIFDSIDGDATLDHGTWDVEFRHDWSGSSDTMFWTDVYVLLIREEFSVVSEPFDVIAGSPAALAFEVQPSDTPVNATMVPAVVVHVLDAGGNLVDWDSSTQIGLSLSGGSAGAGLTGGDAVTVSNGVAMFDALSVDLAGTGYQLEATASSLVAATSGGFAITDLASVTEITAIDPPSSQVVGQPFTVTVTVTGDSPTGTVDVSDGTGGSCQINLPDTSCAMTSTTVGIKTISADYSGDDNHAASGDSMSYEVTQAGSATMITTIDPANSQVLGEDYTVHVDVTGYNPTGMVAVSDGTGGSCSITLPDTSCVLSSTTIGEKTISASYAGDVNNTASSDEAAYQIISSGPVALSFSVNPAYGIADGPVMPTIMVQVIDSLGELVSDDNSTVIELDLETNPTGATLSGTTSITVTNGEAHFADLSIELVGAGYRLQASDSVGELDSALSDHFDVLDDDLFSDRFEVIE